MEIIDISKTDQETIIKTACEVLARGGLVVYPTETVYGIGVDAANQQAVDRLLRYKARREGKPLSIAVANIEMAKKYVDINTEAEKLYSTFLPGPVTIVSMGKNRVASGVQSERGTLGVRIPDYELIREIVKAYGKPITATSANASYKKRPYTVSDIFSNISARQRSLIDLVLDAGQLSPREPSTVIDTTLEQPTVLRQGEIKLSDAITIISHSEEETINLGEKLINQYKHYLGEKALIFALVGKLGAGKTQLTKGIAKALSINKIITSPTYTLENEYDFNYGELTNQLIHIDTWRLFSDEEFLALGFTKMVDDMNVISIEWADKVVSTLNNYSSEAKIVWIKLEYGQKENERIITYSDELR